MANLLNEKNAPQLIHKYSSLALYHFWCLFHLVLPNICSVASEKCGHALYGCWGIWFVYDIHLIAVWSDFLHNGLSTTIKWLLKRRCVVQLNFPTTFTSPIGECSVVVHTGSKLNRCRTILSWLGHKLFAWLRRSVHQLPNCVYFCWGSLGKP